MIGKKWIYSDSERSTPHRQSVGHLRGQVRLWNVVWLVFMDWVISCANEWEDYSSNFGEGVEISRNWATDLWLVFWQGLGTVAVPLVVGLPSLLSWWRIHLRCRRPGFDPWFGKIPWRGERLPTLVFWPGEFHGLYSPRGHRESLSVVVVVGLLVQSCPTLCNPKDCSPPSSSVHRILQARMKNTGAGCHFRPQGIFPTQGSNPGLQHCRQILYHLSSSQSRLVCHLGPIWFFMLCPWTILFFQKLCPAPFPSVTHIYSVFVS